MNHFIQNVLTRHTQAEPTIRPRTRSRFETDKHVSTDWVANELASGETVVDNREVHTAVPSSQSERSGKFSLQPAQNFENADFPDHSMHVSPPSDFIRPPKAVKQNPPSLPISPKQEVPNTSLFNEKWKESAPQKPIYQKGKPISPKTPMESSDNSPTVDPPFAIRKDEEKTTPKSKKELAKPTIFGKSGDGNTPAEKPLKDQQATIAPVEPAIFSQFQQVPLFQTRHPVSDFPDHQPAPTIKVSIGRIEVRAIIEKTPPPIKKRERLKPNMSLADYLKKQK